MTVERLLRSCKRSAKLDFIKWVDTVEPRRIPVHGVDRRGQIATLQDVTPRCWGSLPSAVQSCRLAALEFSIDIAAPSRLPRITRLAVHRQIYDVMARRLAPWTGPHISSHVGQVGSSCQYLVERELALPLPEHPTFPTATLPREVVPGILLSETMLFGDDIRAATSLIGSPVQTQVKLYLKVTDNKAKLPEAQHRVRVEATINAKGLESVFGRPISVSDLAGLPYRDLVTHYLRLAAPKVRMPGWRRPRQLGNALYHVVRNLQRQCADGDAQVAVGAGNYSVRDHRALVFKTLPAATDVLREAVDSLSRSMAAAANN